MDHVRKGMEDWLLTRFRPRDVHVMIEMLALEEISEMADFDEQMEAGWDPEARHPDLFARLTFAGSKLLRRQVEEVGEGIHRKKMDKALEMQAWRDERLKTLRKQAADLQAKERLIQKKQEDVALAREKSKEAESAAAAVKVADKDAKADTRSSEKGAAKAEVVDKEGNAV